ncbi:hypothetical protein [Gordonia sp. GONU]|uniref:hypothetical protein n=1 Tax=Gordonia sp. GONU TaxID=2972949 RepID=UPI0021AD0CF8|nr:hypothetical protein [Gordonia sp. GONU]
MYQDLGDGLVWWDVNRGVGGCRVADSGSGPWVFDKDLPGGVGDNDRVVDGDET